MKPNFLILMTDQQRFDTIAAAGYPHMRTSNLDRLVREGCLFRRGYTPNPICVAARHCLLTGAACRDHGFMANHSIRGGTIGDDALATYPRVFSENGWHTVALGKMHFHPTTEHHGYRQMELMEEIPRYVQDDAYARHLAEVGQGELGAIHGVRPLIYHHPQTALMPEDEHGTFWLGRRAAEIVRENADRPWLMTASWIHPHPPLHIPASWQGHYAGAELPKATPTVRFAPHHPKPGGMIDEAIGGVLRTLEETGQLDRTCILFVSDHGEMLGDNGWFQKGLPYEPSTHIPFVIRYPEKFAPGSTDDRFVDLTDIFPTLLDVAGIAFPYKASHRRHDLPGESLLAQGGRKDRSVNGPSTSATARGGWPCATRDTNSSIFTTAAPSSSLTWRAIPPKPVNGVSPCRLTFHRNP